jgi:hypothetical protein
VDNVDNRSGRQDKQSSLLGGILDHRDAFREITEVATFLIERSKRPVLPNALKEKVSFNLS